MKIEKTNKSPKFVFEKGKIRELSLPEKVVSGVIWKQHAKKI